MIKFRGKRKDNNEWVYGDLETTYGDTSCLSICSWEYGESYKVEHNTVGQFILHKDKNRNEIYPGDIIKVDGEIGVIKREHCEPLCASGFVCRNISNNSPLNLFSKNIEVIGNIYDNPELLEVETYKSQIENLCECVTEVYIIHCDKCSTESVGQDNSMREIVEFLYKKGWRYNNGSCLCPVCSKLIKE